METAVAVAREGKAAAASGIAMSGREDEEWDGFSSDRGWRQGCYEDGGGEEAMPAEAGDDVEPAGDIDGPSRQRRCLRKVIREQRRTGRRRARGGVRILRLVRRR